MPDRKLVKQEAQDELMRGMQITLSRLAAVAVGLVGCEMQYVSINAHVIRRNAKHGTDDPPIRIARSRGDQKPRYAREIRINGPSRLVYDPVNAILRCGASMVIEAPAGTIAIIR